MMFGTIQRVGLQQRTLTVPSTRLSACTQEHALTRLSTTDVAIIGAGPYGLALAAHLQTRNVEYRLFGETMAAWKNNMPAGMLLKSYPWASSIPGPDAQFSLRSFCAERGYPYHDELIPLPLDRFIEYGEAFQERFVAGSCEKRTLTSLEPGADGFRARFADGETVDARRVVIAVGLRPFRHLPEDVAQLPSQLRSHSSDYGSLEHLDGKETVVVGSGASATDLAALLHERGIRTTLVARQSRLRFASRPRPRTLVERLTAPSSVRGGTLRAGLWQGPWTIWQRLREGTSGWSAASAWPDDLLRRCSGRQGRVASG
jgi:cation diffusion facilitator CzcD-associated flavoprotein CzcO